MKKHQLICLCVLLAGPLSFYRISAGRYVRVFNFTNQTTHIDAAGTGSDIGPLGHVILSDVTENGFTLLISYPSKWPNTCLKKPDQYGRVKSDAQKLYLTVQDGTMCDCDTFYIIQVNKADGTFDHFEVRCLGWKLAAKTE